MKKLFSIVLTIIFSVALLTIFVACNEKPNSTDENNYKYFWCLRKPVELTFSEYLEAYSKSTQTAKPFDFCADFCFSDEQLKDGNNANNDTVVLAITIDQENYRASDKHKDYTHYLPAFYMTHEHDDSNVYFTKKILDYMVYQDSTTTLSSKTRESLTSKAYSASELQKGVFMKVEKYSENTLLRYAGGKIEDRIIANWFEIGKGRKNYYIGNFTKNTYVPNEYIVDLPNTAIYAYDFMSTDTSTCKALATLSNGGVSFRLDSESGEETNDIASIFDDFSMYWLIEQNAGNGITYRYLIGIKLLSVQLTIIDTLSDEEIAAIQPEEKREYMNQKSKAFKASLLSLSQPIIKNVYEVFMGETVTVGGWDAEQ